MVMSVLDDTTSLCCNTLNHRHFSFALSWEVPGTPLAWSDAGEICDMPALRLSHKLFLAFALLTGVVLSLAGWSLLTTRRLTAENRAIIERVLPAVRLEIGVLEGIAALRRVEARHAVLRDPAYVRLFVERAQAVESDLGALGELVSTVEERLALASAAEQLRSYRTLRGAVARREP